jgi:hydroxymethylbilane synthase
MSSASPAVLKLGTRRSLLAWSQSEWVAGQIERLNPGTRVELVGIETRGDRILDVSLRKVEGKEFFVAELDDALRSGRVDLTVHSMKDLSLERPGEFTLAAMPLRENPRDVLLVGPHALDRLRRGERLRIGTSSPRRLENLPSFLRTALPQPCAEPEFVEIRGNVNTRLSRTLEEVAHERYLDGVVLAFAGLIRLWANEKARAEMAPMLARIRWMVLPLRECPAAPAQGALAVECRTNDAATRTQIAKLHDAAGARRVLRERGLLAQWGGGCHQRFGATAIDTAELGEMFYVRGAKSDGEKVDTLEWHGHPAPAERTSAAECWDGSAWRARHSSVRPIEGLRPRDLSGEAVFVAHSRAVPADWAASLAGARVWTAGVSSWRRLAEQGIWVEGCSEGLGFDELAPTLGEGVLGLPELAGWKVLTHDGAHDGWQSARPVGEVIATYGVRGDESAEAEREAREGLARARHVYWGSGSQYDLLSRHVPSGATHACGAGKTARHLRARGIDPLVFPSSEEWRQWLGI